MVYASSIEYCWCSRRCESSGTFHGSFQRSCLITSTVPHHSFPKTWCNTKGDLTSFPYISMPRRVPRQWRRNRYRTSKSHIRRILSSRRLTRGLTRIYFETFERELLPNHQKPGEMFILTRTDTETRSRSSRDNEAGRKAPQREHVPDPRYEATRSLQTFLVRISVVQITRHEHQHKQSPLSKQEFVKEGTCLGDARSERGGGDCDSPVGGCVMILIFTST